MQVQAELQTVTEEKNELVKTLQDHTTLVQQLNGMNVHVYICSFSV